ncbi:MAG TPA: ATP-binding cassette domain-containing protein, partial [Pirellulaceae bacterium]|nr:ATP-binding cassette domain-containing protein [Pirellulaceae bacterium]
MRNDEVKEPGSVEELSANGNNVVLRGVTKRYGSRTVLDDISLTIGSGQTAALIGPSGGGKSTILRCINGLSTFEAGQITVGPHVVAASGSPAATAPIRRLFGMIFQDFQLFPHMT